MRPSRFLRPALLPLAALVLAAPPAQAQGSEDLTPAVRRKVREACFEVVVPRPEKERLTYERDLPWDELPFAIRNDKYLSIGTAFAVSERELITAYHVLDPGTASLTYDRYFLRDQQQRVYEIDQVLASDERRDVVRLTAKGLTLPRWLSLSEAFEVNGDAFAVGNAFGEGIVIRRGEVLGTVPEPVDGAFPLLKTSAGVNGGNSGGPLVDKEGRVLAVVLQKRDNLSYTLPSSELKALKPAAVFSNKLTYRFNLIPETSRPMKRELELPLPLSLQELKSKTAAAFHEIYARQMGAFLAEQSKTLFPQGDGSRRSLLDVPTRKDASVFQKDPTDQSWQLADISYRELEAGPKQVLRIGGWNGTVFLELRQEETVPAIGIPQGPRALMDQILKVLPVTRTMGSQKIRITSYGEPLQSDTHLDRQGRRWQMYTFLMDATDQVSILCATATPWGTVMLLREVPSASLHEWLFDLRAILDFTAFPYAGTFAQWQGYLARKDLLPAPFKDMNLAFQANKSLELRSPWLSATFDTGPVDLAADGWIHIDMGFEPRKEGFAWTLRRFALTGGKHDDSYLSLVKHLNPGSGAKEPEADAWKEVLERKAPYDFKAKDESDSTSIATVLPLAPAAQPQAPGGLYTLYLSKPGKQSQRAMRSKLEHVAEALRLQEEKAIPVTAQPAR